MNDQKKLMRLFTVTWFLLLLLILAVLYMSTREPKIISQNFVGQKGEVGQQGPIGKQGLQGADGVNAQSTVVERQTIIQERTTVPILGPAGPQGAPGEKGDQGAPGRDLQIQLNPETKDLEVKYSTDTFWEVIVPCADLLVGCTETEQ